MAGGYNFEGTSKTIRSIICTNKHQHDKVSFVDGPLLAGSIAE
jgi:hypothetical protein